MTAGASDSGEPKRSGSWYCADGRRQPRRGSALGAGRLRQAGAARPLPQPDRRLAGEAVHRQLAVDEADLQRVRLAPAVVELIAIGEEMDALVGRADPAALVVGLFADVG